MQNAPPPPAKAGTSGPGDIVARLAGFLLFGTGTSLLLVAYMGSLGTFLDIQPATATGMLWWCAAHTAALIWYLWCHDSATVGHGSDRATAFWDMVVSVLPLIVTVILGVKEFFSPELTTFERVWLGLWSLAALKDVVVGYRTNQEILFRTDEFTAARK